jgi:hypothetical protein
MAIKKESIKAILAKLKVGTDAEIEALLNDTEEKEVKIPDTVKVFSQEEYTQLETNLKEQGKGAYTKAGKEIAIKELKEKTGIEFDGKDPETFIEKFKENVIAEAKLKPDEAKTQWEKDKKALQDQVNEWKGKYETIETEKKAISFDTTLLKSFPADRNDILTDEDRLLLIKNKMEVKDEDGKQIVYYKGKKLQDNLTNPLEFGEAIKHVFTEEKWLGKPEAGKPGGRGNGDGKTGLGVYGSLKDFNAELTAKNIHPGSEEARNMLNQAIKANPEMDMSIV